MRRTLAVLLLVSLSACGGGSTPTSPTPTPTPTTFTLQGRITDVDTGFGIKSATVTIVDGPDAGKTLATDSIGSYEFNGLRQAGFTLRATADYHQTTSKGVTLTSDSQLNIAMPHTVVNIEYRVTGTASRVDVFYENGTGGSEFQTNVSLPWSKSFQVSKAGVFLYLDSTIDTSGSVTSEIFINGTLFQTATASGQFGSATASGETP